MIRSLGPIRTAVSRLRPPDDTLRIGVNEKQCHFDFPFFIFYDLTILRLFPSSPRRGVRKNCCRKLARGDVIPCILELEGDEKIFRRNWVWLIQEIYKVDPLIGPKCKGAMRIIGSIEDPLVIRRIDSIPSVMLSPNKLFFYHSPFVGCRH